MTFTEFIKQLTSEQVNQWWAQVSESDVPEQEKRNNWKYHLKRDDKQLEFKWAIRDVAKHAKIDFSDFKTNADYRDTFCEAFDFTIHEELVYDITEKKKLFKAYEKGVENKELFAYFIHHAHTAITENNIEPYNIRMAIRPNNDFMVVIGMRAVLFFKQGRMGFIMDKVAYDKVASTLPEEHSYEAFTGGQNRILLELDIDDFHKIDGYVLGNNIECIGAEYEKVKNTKRAQWNVEANTTNSALKYLIFKNEKIESIMNDMIEHKVDFFNSEDIELIQKHVGEKKNNDNTSHNSTYDGLKKTYNKVEYWAECVKNKLFPTGEISIRKRPTNQSNNFEYYLWAKIFPYPNTTRALAFTVSIEEDLFTIKIDTVGNVLFRDLYEDYRGKFNNSEIVELIPASEIINEDWNKLIERTKNFIVDHMTDYDKLLKVLDIKSSKSEFSTIENNTTLNQILYGPPGTGKTYATKEIAVRLINPDFEFKTSETKSQRSEIIEEYNKYRKEEQIVFTTFHQSMSYEDFVEGIKPETTKDDNVVYKTEPGIFKRLCAKADIRQGNFEKVIEDFKQEVAEDEEQQPLEIVSDRTTFEVVHRLGDYFYVSPKNTSVSPKPWYNVNIKYIKHYFETDETTGTNPTYSREITKFLKKNRGLVKGSEDQENKNYVLIIDEINRGNVSAIFGELITLLEEDKRLNKNTASTSEEIKVRLPYSNEDFGVPPNLYIIGTMNTADRSVEALDTALRRRFTFEEVMPKPELLKDILFEGFNLDGLLSIINQRIEVLLDRDHTIGHSYFIKLESGDEVGLKAVFKDSVIPLLQEYFYGDYEKIAWVLGKEFVEYIPKPDIQFPKFKGGNKPETSASFRIINIENDKFDITKAVKELISPNAQAEVTDGK